MSHEFGEHRVYACSFPFVSFKESDFFGMVDEIGLGCSVVTLQALFDGGKTSERWGDKFDEKAREEVPKNDSKRTTPSNKF